MKNFLVIIILLFGLNVYAEVPVTVLRSQNGIVESVAYEDTGENVKQTAVIKVTSGQFKGTLREIDNMLTGNPAYDIDLARGNRVILHLEPVSGFVATADDVDFFIADIKRDTGLLWFAGLFCLMLTVIGRQKGIRSLVSIAATVGIVFFILVPMLLHGFSPVAAAMFACILATVLTIYLVGGVNRKSASAIIGTSLSLVFAAGLSVLAIKIAGLTGFSGEETLFLYAARPDLNFKGILSASMIIAALGAIMDTGISIASTINEIYETNPKLGKKELFTSGMNVGCDIIGTMSNTLILVYLGASLPLVLLSNNIDMNKFFNLNQVASEIISALAGSIGLLVCVPVTAIITAYLIKNHGEQA